MKILKITNVFLQSSNLVHHENQNKNKIVSNHKFILVSHFLRDGASNLALYNI